MKRIWSFLHGLWIRLERKPWQFLQNLFYVVEKAPRPEGLILLLG